MSLRYKLKIKWHFLVGDYWSIKDELEKNKEKVIPYLTNTDVSILINFMKYHCYKGLLLLLLDCADKDQKKEIIYNYCKFKAHYLHIEELHTYYDDFLEYGLEYKDNLLLLTLADIASIEPQKYSSKIQVLKEYFLSKEVDYYFIKVASFDNFTCNEFEEKIINSDIKLVIEYLKKLNEPKDKLFLKRYIIENNYDKECIKALALEFKNNYEYYTEIINITKSITDLNFQSELLYMLYELNSDYKNLVIDIINLNNITIIKKLMKLIDEKEQNKLIELCLEENANQKVFALASSTDCIATYKAIDYVLAQDNFEEILYLIAYIEGRFISYTLDKIIKEKGTNYYLKIINKLYLFNLPNLLESINFIYIYKLEYLFKEIILKSLDFFRKKENKVRKLTLN